MDLHIPKFQFKLKNSHLCKFGKAVWGKLVLIHKNYFIITKDLHFHSYSNFRFQKFRKHCLRLTFVQNRFNMLKIRTQRIQFASLKKFHLFFKIINEIIISGCSSCSVDGSWISVCEKRLDRGFMFGSILWFWCMEWVTGCSLGEEPRNFVQERASGIKGGSVALSEASKMAKYSTCSNQKYHAKNGCQASHHYKENKKPIYLFQGKM